MTQRLAQMRMLWRTSTPEHQLAVGHFLISGPRARVAFEICMIRRCKGTPALGHATFVLGCERHSPGDIPEGATVHRFVWNKR